MSEQQKEEIIEDSPQFAVVEVAKRSITQNLELQPGDARKLYRLKTARYTVILGLVMIVAFAFGAYCGVGDTEVFTDSIYITSAIVTLALGIVAGSTVD